jgi:hypothetical protein
MEKRIEPIELIHFLKDKKVTSIQVEDKLYPASEYTITKEEDECNDYATTFEIATVFKRDPDVSPEKKNPLDMYERGRYVHIRIMLYEAYFIKIEDKRVYFDIRSQCGIGPNSPIVFTLE